jgi:hypothetical protein
MKHGYGLTRSLRGVVFGAALGVVCVGALVFAGVGLALNPERHYELVTPPYKAGFGARTIAAVATDGESVGFFSLGAFAGTPSAPTTLGYVAKRGSSGWSTTPLLPPASLMSQVQGVDVSPSLGTVFALGSPGPAWQNSLPVADLLLRSTAAPDSASEWEQAGQLQAAEPSSELSGMEEVDADPTFCHVLLRNGTRPLLAGAGPPQYQLYEYDRGCGGGPASVKFVGLDNQGRLLTQECAVELGVGGYGANGRQRFNALSADGSEVFFTVCLKKEETHQLFVRVGGVRTLEVSKPVGGGCAEVPCAGALARGSAEFAGASEDGSRVYFTAPLNAGQEPLVAGDGDASNNLYLARIGCPGGGEGCSPGERVVNALSEVSHDPNGEPAEVRGVVRVAPDGERVYFVAGGDLLTGAQRQTLQREGRPLPQTGADNLYVYDDTGSSSMVTFIGDLCSGHLLSGSVEDIHCPDPNTATGSDTPLWDTAASGAQRSTYSEAQTAGVDGRFLVFATYAQLTADDTDNARDVYRYDAQTGKLVRISGGESGYGADGNCNDGSEPSSIREVDGLQEPVEGTETICDATITPGNASRELDESDRVVEQHEMETRAVSEDGSRIVFFSKAALSPAAGNGLSNVYEWHEGGGVSLVSSGSGEAPVEQAVISPDGRNIFFDTTQSLVAEDTDGAPDIYDARLGASVAENSDAQLRPCEGDACQGPLTNPAPLLVPGSTLQTPGENVLPTVAVSTPRSHRAKPKVCRRGRRRNKRGSCVRRVAGRSVRSGSRKGRHS